MRPVAGQAAGNAVVGVVAFQLVELLPGAVERRRAGKVPTAPVRPVQWTSWLEDRRRVTHSPLGPAIRHHRASSRCWRSSFWVLQVVAAREVRGDGGEQPPADAGAAGAARHRVRSRPEACSSRTAAPTASRSSASTPRDLNRTVHLLAAVLGIDEAGVRADRRSPSPRAVVSADHRSSRTRRWRRWPRSRRGGSTSSCPTSSSSRCRRGSYPEAMAAHLFGYVGEVSDARGHRRTTA